MRKYQIEIEEGLRVKTATLTQTRASVFEIWWDSYASGRDKAVFAKYAESSFSGDAVSAWESLDGDSWYIGYKSAAEEGDESNPLLDAVRSRSPDVLEDDNVIDTEYDDGDDEQSRVPMQSRTMDQAILEDLDEDLT